MPNPNRYQPSFAPIVPNTVAVRRTLHALLGLLAVGVLGILAWSPFPALIPGAWIEMLGGVTRFRLLGAALVGALLLAKFLIRVPNPPSRKSVAWGNLAASTGGTLSRDLHGPRPAGWTGGTSVQWSCHGTEVRLGTSADTNRNDSTQFIAILRLGSGFQFHLVQKDAATRALLSMQLWDLALAAERNGAKGRGVAPSSAGVADRLAFLSAREVLMGDPEFDDAFLLKSDSPRLAREFLGAPEIACRLHELDRGCSGWQLSLVSRDGAAYQLTLAVPGAMLDPDGLDAGWKLMEASIRCTADRGALASGHLERPESRPVGDPAAAA